MNDYFSLLRRNRSFRRLWYSQVTSQLGDWLDVIAQFTILIHLTGSGEAVAWRLVMEFLPAALVGLWAGVFVDRLPRKWVMIVTDLGRGVLVLSLLVVHDASQVWILYLVTGLRMSLAAFYTPAREAAIATVTRREDLVVANAISGLTWSIMLAWGAALGGVIVSVLGTKAAFLLDSASFFLSAFFTALIPIPNPKQVDKPATSIVGDLYGGLAYVFSHRDIALYALTKGMFSLGAGGLLLLLTLFGKQLFPLGKDAGLSIGLLYAARGLGCGIGPIVARRWGGDSEEFLRRSLGPSFFVLALGYAFFSAAPSLAWAAGALVVAHMGGTTLWFFSTALIQLQVPSNYQGRVFAVDLTLMAMATALSAYLTGVAADMGWSPRLLAISLAGVFVPPGVFLMWSLWRVFPDAKAAEINTEESR